MELKVKEIDFPKVINFNFEELKQEITSKVALYNNMVYTDETIKEAKSDKASLKKFIDALETKRKEVKSQCLLPYESFANQVKELVDIVNEPVNLIDSQVKEYEEKIKAEKLEEIKKYWESTEHPDWLMCSQIFDQRWLNKTFDMKKVQEAIDETLHKIFSDISTLETLTEFNFEAIDSYKRTLDIKSAIAEGQRLADIQRRKDESRKAAMEKPSDIENSEAELADEEKPVCEMSQSNSENVAHEKQWVKFAAYLTEGEARELSSYFKSKNIEIKAI